MASGGGYWKPSGGFEMMGGRVGDHVSMSVTSGDGSQQHGTGRIVKGDKNTVTVNFQTGNVQGVRTVRRSYVSTVTAREQLPRTVR